MIRSEVWTFDKGPVFAVRCVVRGFTLIELMVVIGIISLVAMIGFPVIRSITRYSREGSGANTVAMAVAAARGYASRTPLEAEFFSGDLTVVLKGQLEAMLGPNPTPMQGELADRKGSGVYSGAAALFTPAGEIRMIENCHQAYYEFGNRGPWPLERCRADDTDPFFAPNKSPRNELNGFADIRIDYITNSMGVAGVIRRSQFYDVTARPDDPPWLIPPPFAVWFDQNGNLMVGEKDCYYVYYNGVDTVDGWNVTQSRETYRRPASLDQPQGIDERHYNPDYYDPATADYVRYDATDYPENGWDEKNARYFLPFEKIETVLGVFCYDKEQFKNDIAADWVTQSDPEHGILSGLQLKYWQYMSGDANRARWQWMQQNGQLVLFSRTTGTLIRSREE